MEVKEQLEKIIGILNYQCKLLESMVEAIDEQRHKGQKKPLKMEKMLRSMLTNPVFANNPLMQQMAKDVQDAFKEE